MLVQHALQTQANAQATAQGSGNAAANADAQVTLLTKSYQVCLAMKIKH